MVLLGVADEKELLRFANAIDGSLFREPDLDDTATAFTFVGPLEGCMKREVSKLKLL